jgi:hypothetical protein
MKRLNVKENRLKISKNEIDTSEDSEKTPQFATPPTKRSSVLWRKYSLFMLVILLLAVWILNFFNMKLNSRKTEQKVQLTSDRNSNLNQLNPQKSLLSDSLSVNKQFNKILKSDIDSTHLIKQNLLEVDGNRHQSSNIRSKPITLEVDKMSGIPTIGGIHNGVMKGSELLKIEKIESGSTDELKSFMIGYFNGTTDVMEFVSGNLLTDKLKQDIILFNTGQTIFFTEMYTTDNDGKLRMLPSINLKILPN